MEENSNGAKKGAKCGHYLKLLALVLMRYASRDSSDISKAASSTKAHEPLLYNSLRFFLLHIFLQISPYISMHIP